MPKLKRGRLSKREMGFIREKAGKLSVEDLSSELRRDPQMIKKWIRENLALDVSEGKAIPIVDAEIKNELRSSPEWRQLKRAFDPEELEYFEHRYAKLISQFSKDEITPSEEIQIFLLIKLEIFMHRNELGRQQSLGDAKRLQEIVDDFAEEHRGQQLSDADRDYHANLENQLVAAREAEKNYYLEYTKYLGEHGAIMKGLKATRDQRLDKVRNSKRGFLDIIKDLQDEKVREREGRDMELMKKATEVEVKRLSKSHKYVDDSYDIPLLNSETVGEEEE